MQDISAASGSVPSPAMTAFHTNAGTLVEPAVLSPSGRERQVSLTSPGRDAKWLPVVILASLLAFLYRHIAVKLVTDWWEIPDFSHGFLIPFFAAFLIWDKRKTLRTIPVQPAWAGITLVLLGVADLLLGVLGADLFLQRTSFVLLA